MKRLCVFYKHADRWLSKRINWIVCQRCQRQLQRGVRLECKLNYEPRPLRLNIYED